MEKTVYIVIGCDTDPDRRDYIPGIPEDTLSWRGMLEGIPQVKERLATIQDSDGKPPVFSWCLRADHQIKQIHGSYSYILDEHRDFLLNLEQSGDELAWHPHFWRLDNGSGKWYQDCFDADWQVAMLKEAHAAYQSSLPGRAKSVRMGWDYHNNSTFSTLESLGIEIDFSGIPGLRIQPKNDSVRGENFFDWSLSPNRPYFPARSDYRRESKPDEAAFSMPESPNFVSESRVWGLISGLVLSKKMKDVRPFLRSLMRPTYWIGVTGKPQYFMPLISQVERTLGIEDRVIFVTYFHPDELIENSSGRYSLDYMEQNVSLLVDTMKRLGFHVKFIQAKAIRQIITGAISE